MCHRNNNNYISCKHFELLLYLVYAVSFICSDDCNKPEEPLFLFLHHAKQCLPIGKIIKV